MRSRWRSDPVLRAAANGDRVAIHRGDTKARSTESPELMRLRSTTRKIGKHLLLFCLCLGFGAWAFAELPDSSASPEDGPIPCPPISPSEHPFIQRLGGHAVPCVALAFSPDGTILAAGSSDGSLSVWNLLAGNPDPAMLHHLSEGPTVGVAFAPDGSGLVSATASGEIRFWGSPGFDTYGSLLVAAGQLTSLAIHPGGRQLVVGTATGEVLCWDLVAGRATSETPSWRMNVGCGVTAVTYTDEVFPAVWVGLSDGQLQLWSPNSGTALASRQTRDGAIVACQPSGGTSGLLLSASASGEVAAWDGPSLKCIWDFDSPIRDIAFSRSSGLLLIGAEDGTVSAVEPEGCEFLGGILRFDTSVTSVDFHPCGKTFACSSTGGQVVLVDLVLRSNYLESGPAP